MKKINYILYLGLMLFLYGNGPVFGQDGCKEIPDSLLTEDHVYEFTFSDFDKARRILEEMRKQKRLASFKLDLAEGDLYFNTGRYYQALKFYGRLMESDSVRKNSLDYMEQIHRMISCYDCLHEDEKKMRYVELLLEVAEQNACKEMKSVALFNMGKTIYNQGNKEQGYLYMEEAVEEMKQSDYKYKYDNLRYNYNTLLVLQEKDQLYEKAVRTLDRLEEVVTEAYGKEPYIEGLEEKEKKALYAHRAVVLSRLGKKKEAAEAYRLFNSVGRVYDKDNYLIMPYLFDRGMYDEVIRLNTAREKFLQEQKDTVTYHMTTIKHSLGNAYRAKGDYQAAAAYFEQLAALRDSIKRREQASAAIELAAVYETNEKEIQLQQQKTNLRERTLLLSFSIGISLLLAVWLWRTVRHNQIIRYKNATLATTIEGLLGYKEEVYRQRDEIHRLEKQMQTEQASSETASEQNEVFPVEENEPKQNEAEKALFEKLETLILTEKLYLQPDFSREEFIRRVHVSKNSFAHLFKQYAGTSFTMYMNRLRLEHAARLLKKYPEYTINAVAEECGIFTIQTFHRLFLSYFGMTPAEYRSGLKKADNLKITDKE